VVGQPCHLYFLIRTLTHRRLNFSNPTILNLGNTTWNPEYAIIPESYDRGYVYIVITTQPIRPDPSKNIHSIAAHPIHLHGHDFVILAQSNQTYDVSATPKTFNFNNPPRRDVALLPAGQTGGYLAIGFKPDNPGVWLVHCHIGKLPPNPPYPQPPLPHPLPQLFQTPHHPNPMPFTNPH
jgi:hypothetical protein